MIAFAPAILTVQFQVREIILKQEPNTIWINSSSSRYRYRGNCLLTRNHSFLHLVKVNNSNSTSGISKAEYGIIKDLIFVCWEFY